MDITCMQVAFIIGLWIRHRTTVHNKHFTGLVLVCHGNGKTCYDIVCFHDNCVEQAINSGNAKTCQMNESYGCEFTKMVSDSVREIAKCPIMKCSPLHNAPKHDSSCCTDENCNSKITSPEPSSAGLCHSYMCTTGEDCFKKGIENGYSRVCPMDPKYGCYVMKSDSSEMAGCSDHRCVSAFVEQRGHKSVTKCCSSNLCNDDTQDNTGSGGENGSSIYLPSVSLITCGLLSVMKFY